MAPWEPKYTWVVKWPGEGKEDWVAFDGGLCIGRVQRDTTSLMRGTFVWNGNCSEWHGFHFPTPQNGRTAEAWEAAKAIEEWYDEGLKRSGSLPPAIEDEIRRLR